MILFYTDEDTTPLLARALRTSGRDAVSAHEISARGLTDEEQLMIAADQGRAIVSCNFGDFTQLSSESWEAGVQHAGIIVSYRQIEPDIISDATAALMRVAELYDDVGLSNRLITLQDFWPTD